MVGRKGTEMRRTALIGLIGGLAGVGMTPAAADVAHNPNSVLLEQVTCENGLTFDQVRSATPQAVVGIDVDDHTVGVATSLWVTDSAGTPIPGAVLFDRPGQGLDALTTWCWWPDGGSPTGWAGGEILFGGQTRQ